MANNKYKMFMNYMHNDLEITREDIKQWTKEAISERVDKLVGQINMLELASRALPKSALERLAREAISIELVRVLSNKIEVRLKQEG